MLRLCVAVEKEGVEEEEGVEESVTCRESNRREARERRNTVKARNSPAREPPALLEWLLSCVQSLRGIKEVCMPHWQ